MCLCIGRSPFLIGRMDVPTPERIELDSRSEEKVSRVKSARRTAARPPTGAAAPRRNVAQTLRIGETRRGLLLPRIDDFYELHLLAAVLGAVRFHRVLVVAVDA